MARCYGAGVSSRGIQPLSNPTSSQLLDTGRNLRAQRTGLVLGPVLLIALIAFPPPGMDPPAQRLAAVFALVVIYWVTEAIPLAVTALLGVALAVVLGAADTQTAFAGFSDPTVFLLIGSFLLVEATRAHGLDQRLAYGLMAHPWVGDSREPERAEFGLTQQ